MCVQIWDSINAAYFHLTISSVQKTYNTKNTKTRHGWIFLEIIYVNASPTHAQGKSTYLHDNIVYGMKSIFECLKSDVFGTFLLIFVDIKI